MVVATHDVQLLTLLSPTTVGGEEHVRHVSWHGRQKFVPFGAVPGGHTAVHLPPFRVWVVLAHVMQVSVPAPSHVAPDRAKGEQRISTDLQRPGPKFEWRSVTASVAASANAAAVAEQPGGASGHARTTEQVGPEPWLRIPVARLVLLRDRRHAPHRPGIPRLAATQAACAVGRAARVAIEVEARPALAMLPLRPGAVVAARHHARTARKHSTWRAVEGIERRRGARYALEVDASLVARAITPFAPRVTARANATGVSERAVRARGNARGVVKQRLDLRWTD